MHIVSPSVLAALDMQIGTDSLGLPKLTTALDTMSRPSGWSPNQGFPHIPLRGAASRFTAKPYDAERREEHAAAAERVYEQEALEDGFIDRGNWCTGMCENTDFFDFNKLKHASWWLYVYDNSNRWRVAAFVVLCTTVLYLSLVLNTATAFATLAAPTTPWAVFMLALLAPAPVAMFLYYKSVATDTEEMVDRLRATRCLLGLEPALCALSWLRRKDWRREGEWHLLCL